MTMFVFWTTVTMLALLLGAGIAAVFCYSLFFKFVGVALLGGAFITWILRP
nr:MAG TPA: Intrinsic membrane protein pufX protein, quinone exchange, photosynthesis [Caudoviricetes sp.]